MEAAENRPARKKKKVCVSGIEQKSSLPVTHASVFGEISI